jgi:hypothetical protein
MKIQGQERKIDRKKQENESKAGFTCRRKMKH